MKKISLFYNFCLVILLVVFSFVLYRGNWLETDLKALLPTEQKWTAEQIKAAQIQENQLNRQIVLLVGSQEPTHSFHLAETLAQKLQASGLFSQIFAKNQPNLTALQTEIQQLKWAILPEKVYTNLLEKPSAYFQQLAESMANPFGERNLLPIEQDWLGFGRFALSSSSVLSKMQWDAQTGAIFVKEDGKTWTLIRAELAESDFINPQANLLSEMEQAKQFAEANQAELLLTGSAIFGAMAKQSAEKESILMSILGVGLTLSLLLWVFRTLKALWLFLPIGLGLVAGIVATVLCFGQIHILTLVVGTSLIGVLIDFPLHWLTGAKFSPSWNSKQAMMALKPTFMISLLVTLLGYGLLAFTTLPILKQTALFSAVALVMAMGATTYYLPYLVTSVAGTQAVKKTEKFAKSRYVKPCLLGALVLIWAGIYRSQWQDDIRQWVALPEQELQEAAQIGKLTGIDLSTQYFLVTAENDEQLLERNHVLAQKLEGKGVNYQALSQWVLSEKVQKQRALQISANIRPLDYAVLNELGIPNAPIQQAIDELKNQPTISLQQALNSSLGQGWKTLYLGDLAQGKVGSTVKVQNATAEMNLAALADNQTIFWQDKRSHLNQSFQATRNQAAWLKLASFALAFLLLWQLFGTKMAAKMLAIPLVAMISTVGVLGWLGLPITLFAMFGLLLVSAIGIDYVAYMATAKETMQAKRFAVSLAATTTMISFILLALSSTPAVASFGISVSVGVLFSLILTLIYAKNLEQKNANAI